MVSASRSAMFGPGLRAPSSNDIDVQPRNVQLHDRRSRKSCLHIPLHTGLDVSTFWTQVVPHTFAIWFVFRPARDSSILYEVCNPSASGFLISPIGNNPDSRTDISALQLSNCTLIAPLSISSRVSGDLLQLIDILRGS